MSGRRLFLASFVMLLAIVIFAASIYDIVHEKGWIVGVFLLYGLLLVPLLALVLSTRRKPLAVTSATEKQFRCPSCRQTFRMSILPEKPVFTHACPHCGYVGSVSRVKP